MASKIKSLGYIGDCGYNQLLYPVEGQTRTMLLWLVQKLPRVEEEREVDVGSSARFNRRIHDRLAAWKETTWKLPFCSTGEGPLSKNIYSRRALYTLDTHGPAIQIIRESSQAGKAFESSLLEKHSLLLAKEGLLSSTTQDFELASDELDSLSLNGGVDDPRTKLKNALKSAKTEHMAAYGGSSSGNGGRGRTNTVDSRSLNNQSGAVSAADLYGKSFNELIAAIKDNATDTTTSIVPATDGSSSDASMLVGTVGGRFQQATKFAQESEGLSINEGVLTSLALGTSVTSVDSAPVDVVNSSDVPVVVSTDQSTEDTAAAEEAAIIALAEELEGMRATLQTRLQQYIEAEDEESSRPARIIQFQNEVKELQARCDEMEKEIMIKKQTLELLPKAADNVRALTAECDEQSKHLSSLADEWEVHRAPLLERLNSLQLLKSQRRQRCKEMIEDIKRYKEEIAGMAPELREKQAKSVALQEERAKLNQDVSRSIYTEKILMVTRNLAKHNAEVEKVCGDIRELQRDIGRTTEALQRADAVAEEFTFAVSVHFKFILYFIFMMSKTCLVIMYLFCIGCKQESVWR